MAQQWLFHHNNWISEKAGFTVAEKLLESCMNKWRWRMFSDSLQGPDYHKNLQMFFWVYHITSKTWKNENDIFRCANISWLEEIQVIQVIHILHVIHVLHALHVLHVIHAILVIRIIQVIQEVAMQVL